MNSIVQRDLERIYNGLTAEERAGFAGSTLLFTGGAGFLGFYFMEFFSRFRQELGVRKVICLDNFQGDIRRGSGPSATGGMWTARGPGPATMRRSGLGRPCATCSARDTKCPSPSSAPLTTTGRGCV